MIAEQLDELAARAWPATTEERVDGWLLRHTPGVQRRRSNSALPVGDGPHPIEVVSDFYAERDPRALVQVSPAHARGELDRELDRGGWRPWRHSHVLAAPLATVLERCEPGGAVELCDEVTPAWMSAWTDIERRPDSDATHELVLTRIEPPAAFALAPLNGAAAGIAFAVCERGWAGLFCMATRSDLRRRGIGTAVLGSLAQWAADQGAEGMYLQVEADNPAALALYERSGFELSHDYHYRTRSLA